jgi:hypothetical protein
MSKSRKKKRSKDFPNNWAFYHKLKSKHFETYTFSELMDGLANHWELLPGIQLVARQEHLTTGEIKERSFQTVPQVVSFFSKLKKSGEPYHVYCFDPHQAFTAVFGPDDD